MNIVNYLETLWQDFRFGARMLRKSPAFLAPAVLSLGLGIGANTTIFSFVNALLFRSPSVQAQSELLELAQTDRKASGIESFVPLSFPAYEFYRDSNEVFSALSAFDGEMRPTSWSRSGGGELIQGQLVSSNFFSVLGVKPELGRDFFADEGRVPATNLVVLLSYPFWQRAMGADRGAVGRVMTLNGQPFTVVGIAPQSFTGVIIGAEPDFWTPLPAAQALTHERGYLESWGSSWLFAVGRLRPNLKSAAARASLSVLAKRLQQTQPQTNQYIEAAVFPLQLVPAPVRGYVDAFGGLLMSVVGLVLLIACANTANLVMAKAVSRRRETAVRAALGASRMRLIRQALTESILLGVLGGALGLTLAFWGVSLLLGLKPPSLPVRIGVPIDWHVFAFGGVLAILTGVCFGLLPAMRSSRLDLVTTLRDDRAGAGPRRSRLRSALVVAQLSTCVLLLISAGLCVRSLLNAQSIDPGFDTRHTVLMTVDPGSVGYSHSQISLLYKQLLARVEALPGVSSASLTAYLPLGTGNRTEEVGIEGRQPASGSANFNINTMYVGPAFCQTMGIALLRGREFVENDAGALPSPVLINEAMARRFWPRQDPLGLRVNTLNGKSSVSMVVVGIVATGKYRTLSEKPLPVLYRLIGAMPKVTLVARTEGEPRALLESVRREIQQIDSNVVPIQLESMLEYMKLPLFPARTTGILLAIFGVLALVLAVTGVYGVTSYTVGQRTREIGVRVALGATRGDILKLVLQEGLALTLVGLTLGVAAALGVTRVLSSLLYGISTTDVLTFLAVPALMAGVTLLACYLPARRATRVDPLVALRYE